MHSDLSRIVRADRHSQYAQPTLEIPASLSTKPTHRNRRPQTGTEFERTRGPYDCAQSTSPACALMSVPAKATDRYRTAKASERNPEHATGRAMNDLPRHRHDNALGVIGTSAGRSFISTKRGWPQEWLEGDSRLFAPNS